MLVGVLVALLATGAAALLISIPADVGAGATACPSLRLEGWSSPSDECSWTTPYFQAYVIEAIVLAITAGVLLTKPPTRRAGRLAASVPLTLVLALSVLEGLGALVAHEYIDRWLGFAHQFLATLAACLIVVVWTRPGRDAVGPRAVTAVVGLGVVTSLVGFALGRLTEPANLVGAAASNVASDCDARAEALEPLPAPATAYGVSYTYLGDDPGVELSDADGTNAHRIASGTPGPASWSSSGQRAVVSDGIEMTLIELRPDGTSRDRSLGAGDQPVLEPAGRRIAFIIDGRLHVRDLDRNDDLDLGQADDLHPPVWSPDGRRIAATVGKEVVVMDRDGSDRVLLPRVRGGSAGSPAWSPTGDLIAYLDGEGVALAHPDGSGREVIVVGTGRWFPMTPQWSADGEHLSFVRASLGDPRGGFVEALCVASAAGGALWRVPAAVPFFGQVPAWSPDGRLLLAKPHPSADRDDALVSVDVSTGEVQVLASDAVDGAWVHQASP